MSGSPTRGQAGDRRREWVETAVRSGPYGAPCGGEDGFSGIDPSDLECGEPNDDDGDRGDAPGFRFPGQARADAAAACGGRAGEEDGPRAGPALHLRPGASETAPPVPSGPGAP